MKRILVCVLCLLLLCGCCVENTKSDNSKLTVVTTIFPLYDFAKQIAGDKAQVKMLLQPGNEVHSYDPLPSDMKAIYNSDLFIYIGGESDRWVDTILDGTEINDLSLMTVVKQHEHEHTGEMHMDEHIWTSPENAVIMLNKICESIINIDAKNASYYQKNCDTYAQKISQASQQINNTISKCQNPFVLVADRFPFVYFAEQYGLNYEAAFDGCAVSTDISIKTMSKLTETIKQKDVKTVFVTELSNKNIADALHQEFGVKVLELHSAHNVTKNDFYSGVSYVDILKRNNRALEEGLNNGLN